MIKRIFFDMDECIIHTASKVYDGETPDFFYADNTWGNTYPVFVHKGALRAINHARKLVGTDNVYILTQGEGEYARDIIKQANFGFDNDHIIPREIIKAHYVHVGYGKDTIPHELANKNNVLIDNLPFIYNRDKIGLMGIRKENYIQVEDFYGINNNEFEKVIQKLDEINNRVDKVTQN